MHSKGSHSVVSDSLWPHRVLQARILEWVTIPFSRGSSQTRSPVLQADSLPAEPPGKPKNTGGCSLSLLQGIFLTQELNQGRLHCRRILYQLSYQGSPPKGKATETINKIKRQPSEWEKIIANKTDKGLICKIYKQLTQLNTRKTEDPSRLFSKDDINRWPTHTWKDDIAHY